MRVIVNIPDYALAHEAAVYFPEKDEFAFAANAGGPLGRSGLNMLVLTSYGVCLTAYIYPGKGRTAYGKLSFPRYRQAITMLT